MCVVAQIVSGTVSFDLYTPVEKDQNRSLLTLSRLFSRCTESRAQDDIRIACRTVSFDLHTSFYKKLYRSLWINMCLFNSFLMTLSRLFSRCSESWMHNDVRTSLLIGIRLFCRSRF